MFKKIILGILLVASSSTNAAAENSCGERKSYLAQLSEKFAESHAAIGTTADGGILEIFASDQGTWTILVSFPNGQSCFVAAGRDWEALAKISNDPEA